MTASIFYIVQPPSYSSYAPLLLASIRKFFREPVKVFGYCPEDMLADIPQAVIDVHKELDAEIRTIPSSGKWSPPYPHGNKILAAMDDRGTDYSIFMDTDVVFVNPVSLARYCGPGQVFCSPAASMGWGGDEEWARIYGHMDMPVPTERINLLRIRKKHTFLPYYSAGMVGFPEMTQTGMRFGDLWYETATRIDEIEGLNKKRPYLDQMALPLAIQRSGFRWQPLTEACQYILGGRRRESPCPITNWRPFTIAGRNF